MVADNPSAATYGDNMSEGLFASIYDKLPSYLSRKDVGKFFGAIISPRYMANLDSINKGPVRLRIGRKTVYRKEDLIAWLQARTTEINPTEESQK